MQSITLRLGDSFEEIPKLKSIGAVVSDPPYLISFMNKDWDDTGEANVDWFAKWLAACFVILPPDGIVKIFSATRTFHRLAQAMERVGFKDISLEAWMYGSGFPKSMNVSKAVDAHLGHDREVVDTETRYNEPSGLVLSDRGREERQLITRNITKATSDEGQRFEGWGTALKPAWEPFVVARKP
jgi:hypothetical protein